MAKFLLEVKIRKEISGKWYKKGEKHLVLPKATLSFVKSGEPYFEKSRGFYGIRCSDCTILRAIPQP